MDGILVFYKFEKVLRKAIHSYKYKFRKEVGIELSEIFRKNFLETDINFLEKIFVVPVPLHKNRFSWRGFNQSENFAKSISFNAWNVDLSSIQQEKFLFADVLERTKDTRPQVGLEKLERMENIKNAFGIKKDFEDFVKGKSFLLVDDIVTTGSTLKECAKVLKNSGAKSVFAVTLCLA
ncbi:MAG: hypothetical protein Fur0024_4310 [Patescibacteria group bacterium]